MSALTASTGLRGLTLALVADWATTFSLIFGGCCSNALTLEQLTRAHPHAGSLITFAQFALIAAHGLPTFLVWSRPSRPAPWAWLRVPALRARKIPLAPYAVQVALFYAVSLLNNAAFAYRIPMPVHIIFRSGGLVVSMVMGWAIAGKRYNMTQVASVLLVTAGVVLTTLSASKPKVATASGDGAPASQYATGIALLTLALVLGGALGLVQDWTYGRYARSMPAGRARAAAAAAAASANGHSTTPEKSQPAQVNGGSTNPSQGSPEKEDTGDDIQPWQESMFYLHFLSLPMFFFVRHDLLAQFHALRASPPLVLVLPPSLASHLPALYPPIGLAQPLSPQWTLAVPRAFVPLALTSLTSLVCVAGVNRLTARVSSLTVTLVLVVRKAVSMLISVVLFGQRAGEVDARLMWAGAALVFLGTMGYGAGSRRGKVPVEKTKKE